MLHELFITHCTNGTSVMDHFTRLLCVVLVSMAGAHHLVWCQKFTCNLFMASGPSAASMPLHAALKWFAFLHPPHLLLYVGCCLCRFHVPWFLKLSTCLLFLWGSSSCVCVLCLILKFSGLLCCSVLRLCPLCLHSLGLWPYPLPCSIRNILQCWYLSQNLTYHVSAPSPCMTWCASAILNSVWSHSDAFVCNVPMYSLVDSFPLYAVFWIARTASFYCGTV